MSKDLVFLGPRNQEPNTDDNSNSSNRDRYYQFLRTNLDDYSNLSFSEEEQARVERKMRQIATGSSTLVILDCTADACPFKAKCPYYQIGKAPVGSPCLVEAQLLQHWTMLYMEEYDVNPESFTEVGYCTELAEIEVMLYRINSRLSLPENADGTIVQTVGFSDEGQPIQNLQTSPLFIQKEKLMNRKSRIIKLMVGDRQEKYKKEAALKIRESKDPSQKMSEIKRQIESLSRSLEAAEKKGFLPAEEDSVSLRKDGSPENKQAVPKEKKPLTPDEIISSLDDD